MSELSRLRLYQSRLHSEYAGLRFERRQLEDKISRLQDGAIGVDFLEYLARSKLKMVREDETVLILPIAPEVR